MKIGDQVPQTAAGTASCSKKSTPIKKPVAASTPNKISIMMSSGGGGNTSSSNNNSAQKVQTRSSPATITSMFKQNSNQNSAQKSSVTSSIFSINPEQQLQSTRSATKASIIGSKIGQDRQTYYLVQYDNQFAPQWEEKSVIEQTHRTMIEKYLRQQVSINGSKRDPRLQRSAPTASSPPPTTTLINSLSEEDNRIEKEDNDSNSDSDENNNTHPNTINAATNHNANNIRNDLFNGASINSKRKQKHPPSLASSQPTSTKKLCKENSSINFDTLEKNKRTPQPKLDQQYHISSSASKLLQQQQQLQYLQQKQRLEIRLAKQQQLEKQQQQLSQQQQQSQSDIYSTPVRGSTHSGPAVSPLRNSNKTPIVEDFLNQSHSKFTTPDQHHLKQSKLKFSSDDKRSQNNSATRNTSTTTTTITTTTTVNVVHPITLISKPSITKKTVVVAASATPVAPSPSGSGQKSAAGPRFVEIRASTCQPDKSYRTRTASVVRSPSGLLKSSTQKLAAYAVDKMAQEKMAVERERTKALQDEKERLNEDQDDENSSPTLHNSRNKRQSPWRQKQSQMPVALTREEQTSSAKKEQRERDFMKKDFASYLEKTFTSAKIPLPASPSQMPQQSQQSPSKASVTVTVAGAATSAAAAAPAGQPSKLLSTFSAMGMQLEIMNAQSALKELEFLQTQSQHLSQTITQHTQRQSQKQQSQHTQKSQNQSSEEDSDDSETDIQPLKFMLKKNFDRMYEIINKRKWVMPGENEEDEDNGENEDDNATQKQQKLNKVEKQQQNEQDSAMEDEQHPNVISKGSSPQVQQQQQQQQQQKIEQIHGLLQLSQHFIENSNNYMQYSSQTRRGTFFDNDDDDEEEMGNQNEFNYFEEKKKAPSKQQQQQSENFDDEDIDYLQSQVLTYLQSQANEDLASHPYQMLDDEEHSSQLLGEKAQGQGAEGVVNKKTEKRDESSASRRIVEPMDEEDVLYIVTKPVGEASSEKKRRRGVSLEFSAEKERKISSDATTVKKGQTIEQQSVCKSISETTNNEETITEMNESGMHKEDIGSLREAGTLETQERMPANTGRVLRSMVVNEKSVEEKLPSMVEPKKVLVNTSSFGNFEGGDKARRIITVRPSENEIFIDIEWEPRADGVQPKKSTVNAKAVREFDHHLLLDFYESKIKFTSNSGSKKKASGTKQQQQQSNSYEGGDN